MSLEEKIIVLRKIRHGEGDLIVHGLNRNGAKVGFFAKSAVQSKKRFGGGILEPTHFIQVQYKKSRDDHSLHHLNNAVLLESFPGLRLTYDRLEVALNFVSVVDKIAHEGDIHNEALFDLLGHSLRAASTSDHLALLRLQFHTKLLSLQGVLPFIEDADLLLSASVREHEELVITEEKQFRIRAQVDHVLGQFIN